MTIHVGATITTPVSSWVKVPDAVASAAVPGATTAAMANAADAAPKAGAAGEITVRESRRRYRSTIFMDYPFFY